MNHKHHKKAPEEQAKGYRWLAQKVRETARTVSTERERTELLAMAKMWDFLADHGPHVRH
jgi:hypothetical protein